MLDNIVEQVAMDDPEAFAIGGDVNMIILDRDITEVEPGVLACRLVMIAWYVDYACAVPRLAEQLLDHVIMLLWPVEALLELPAVDDVPDEVERIASRVFQEVKKVLGSGPGRSKVGVRYPDGTVGLNVILLIQQSGSLPSPDERRLGAECDANVAVQFQFDDSFGRVGRLITRPRLQAS